MPCLSYHYLMLLAFFIMRPLIISAHDQPVDNREKKSFNTTIHLHELAKTPYYTKVIDTYKATFNNQSVDIPEEYVINLPNAQLLGNCGMIITENNQPFYDYVSETDNMIENSDNWKVKKVGQALSWPFYPQPTLFNETIALLAMPVEDCYFHWMLEVLPRLKILQMSGYHYDKVFISSHKSKFKKETLNKLGLTDDQIICGNGKSLIQADNIIIPSIPHTVKNNTPQWACDFIRSAFLDTTISETSQPLKRLYIARRYVPNHWSNRFVVNEKEVFEYLEKKGFEQFYLEDLPFNEQTKLFNSAEIIIAAHGAGLTNLIFCNSQRPVTIIEMFNPHYVHKCYLNLIKQFNHDRNFQINHISLITSTERLSPQDRSLKNLYVEVSQLDTIINSLTGS